MNKILALFTILILINFNSRAQAPQGINYQGVARNSSGAAMSMTNINVRFTILQNGSTVYQETHSAVTDTFGLYNKIIGQGTPVQGNFISINWGGGNTSIQVEIDDNSGSGYQVVGTSQLESVPYALYANNAGNTAGGTLTSISVGGGLTASPTNPITSAGTIDLPTFGTGTNTYGSSTSVPVITVDQYGRVITASTQTISAGIASVGTTNPVTNSGTSTAPIIGITQAGTTSDGYLSQTDWNAFNGKVSSVNATSPLSVSGTSTPTVSILKANGTTSGYLDFNDWLSFNNKVGTITTSTGILSSSIGASYTLTADASNPIWNAAQLQGTPVSNTAPLTNDVLTFNGTQWSSSPLPPALPPPTVGSILFSNNLNNWVGSNPSTLFTDGNNIGMGTNSPQANLDIISTNTLMAVNIMNNATGGGLNIQTSPTANVYGLKSFQQGSVQAGYFEIYNNTNVNDAVYAQTNGPGNAVKGYTSVGGNGVMGWNDNQTGGGAGIIGYSTGFGNAGVFQVQNSGNTQEALKVSTLGTGYSASFTGGAGVKTDKLQITGPTAPVAGYVLTTDNLGNASWSPASGTLPGGALGQLLYNNGSGWVPTNNNLYFDGNSVGVGTTTPGALLDVGPSSVPLTTRITNTAANGTALYVNTSNASNSNPAVQVQQSGTGYSAVINGGAGAQIDKLEIQTALHYSPGANNNFVLTSNALGDASWAPLPPAVQSITATGPITSTGGLNPAIGMSNSGVLPGTYGGPTQYPQITIDQYGRVTSASAFAMGGTLNGGTANYIPKWTGASTLSSTSLLFDNGTGVGVNTTAPGAILDVLSTAASTSVAIRATQANIGNSVATFTTNNASNNVAAVVIGTAGTGSGLNINTGGGNGINATTSGTTGMAANFQNTNTGNNNPVVNVTASGPGPGVNVNTSGSGAAVEAVSTSASGMAGYFSMNNASNNNYAVGVVSSSSVSTSLYVNNTGNGSGKAADIQIIGAASTADVLWSTTNGKGKAANFGINNATSSSPAVNITTNGTGDGLDVTATNTTAAAAAIYAQNSGTGVGVSAYSSGTYGVYANNTGTGSAGGFFNNNGSYALSVQNNGNGGGVTSQILGTLGPAGNFVINNAANTAPGIQVNTTGVGSGASISINNTGNNSNGLDVNTNGGGFSGNFNGGNGLRTDKIEIFNGASPNAVLVSTNGSGDATWAAPVNFAVEKSSTAVASNTATTMAFQTNIYQNPVGSVSAGVFTAPVAGLYHFDCGVNMNITTGPGSVSDVVVRLVINGTSYRESQLHLPVGYTGAAHNIIGCDAQLAAGAQVRVDVFQTTGLTFSPVASPANHNFFNGHIVR